MDILVILHLFKKTCSTDGGEEGDLSFALSKAGTQKWNAEKDDYYKTRSTEGTGKLSSHSGRTNFMFYCNVLASIIAALNTGKCCCITLVL